MVKLPANATFFLQPCDRSVNKSFQENVRKTRDEQLSMCHANYANVALKIKLAVAGHRVISPQHATKSFKET